MTDQQLSLLYHTHESQHSDEEILAYWTPERRAAAQTPPSPAEERLLNESRFRPGTSEEPGALTYETTLVPKGKLRDYPYQSVGKIFFTQDGSNWAASAAVVAEDGIITAAHNLYDRKTKTWADRIMFCPAYTDGHANDAYGSWTYREYAVPEEWMKAGDTALAYDVAFVKLRLGLKIHGQIGHVVRQLPLLIDMEPVEGSTTWLSVGYPAVPITGYDFDGQDMWQCQGPFIDKWGAGILSKEGNLTKGSSGGPWIFNRNGYDSVNGVTSFINPGGSENYASYFGKWVEVFFKKYFVITKPVPESIL